MGAIDYARRLDRVATRFSDVEDEMGNARSAFSDGRLLVAADALLRARADINRALLTIRSRGARI